MLVQELMTTNPIVVRPDTTVKAALALLDDNNITALPVVTPSGQVAGVVSEADLIRDLVGPDPRLHEGPIDGDRPLRPRWVADVMSPCAVTVQPETDLEVAVELATSTGIKSLPVVDDGDRVVGMISRRDVVRMLARSDETLEREVDAFLVSTGVRDWFVEVHEGVVELTGPPDGSEASLVTVLARTIPGVLEVRVR